MIQASGGLAAAGAALAVTGPCQAAALAAWAVFGLGLAGVAPTVLREAAKVDGVPAPVAIATVTTVGYLGSFTGPPLIGAPPS